MSNKYSQGHLERAAGKVKASIDAADIAFVDGGAGNDLITQISEGLVAAGFEVGDMLEIHNAPDSDNNGIYPILAVAVGQIDIPTGSLASEMTAGSSIKLKAAYPGSFRHMYFNSQLDIYTGDRPATPNHAETGTLLVSFFGVKFGDAVWDTTALEAAIDLFAATVLSATAVAGGQAAWYRLRGGGVTTTGASTTAPRVDGKVGVGTGDLRVASTTVATGDPASVSSLKYTFKMTPSS
ncbi:MAG: hypothetical protein KKB20_18620 [Proteobacteria bacterium]|nr:hypothetical protein [Pseudomonadota bacterium]